MTRISPKRSYRPLARAVLEGSDALSPASYVDIQLVSDALAADVPFTQEYGRRQGTSPAYHHISLADELGSQIGVVSDYVRDGIERLSSGLNIVLFIAGTLEDDDVEDVDARFCVSAYAEDLGVNGECNILEVESADLRYYMEHFFHYDRVKGVALAPGATSSFLGDLPFLDFVPSTHQSSMTDQPSPGALAAALRHGVFFFEELLNGTQLRLVTADASELERRASIDAAFPPNASDPDQGT